MNTIENSLAREPSVEQERREALHDRRLNAARLTLLCDAVCVMRGAIEQLQANVNRLAAETGSHLLQVQVNHREAQTAREWVESILDVGFWDDWITDRLRYFALDDTEHDTVLEAFRDSLTAGEAKEVGV